MRTVHATASVAVLAAGCMGWVGAHVLVLVVVVVVAARPARASVSRCATPGAPDAPAVRLLMRGSLTGAEAGGPALLGLDGFGFGLGGFTLALIVGDALSKLADSGEFQGDSVLRQ